MDLYLNYKGSVDAASLVYDVTAGYNYQNFYNNGTNSTY